jgi:hypothetical protein
MGAIVAFELSLRGPGIVFGGSRLRDVCLSDRDALPHQDDEELLNHLLALRGTDNDVLATAI